MTVSSETFSSLSSSPSISIFSNLLNVEIQQPTGTPITCICDMLVKAHKEEWLGTSLQDKAEVFQWLSTAEKIIKYALDDVSKRESVLDNLNQLLSKKTFIVSNQPTAADISLYAIVHITMKRFAPILQDSAPNLVRWYDLIQHLVYSNQLNPQGYPISIPMVVIDVNATLNEPAKKNNGSKPSDSHPVKKSGKEDTNETIKSEEVKHEAGRKKNSAVPPKVEKTKEKEVKKAIVPASDSSEISPALILFKVGLIKKIDKHPDADSLYVEEVDLGSETRTVVSGLVKFLPPEALLGKMFFFVCNLKPAKMRGIESQGMLLACTDQTDDTKLELLLPPPDSNPGDLGFWENYPGTPEKQLNTKKKIWETVQPCFRSDETRRAIYTGPNGKVGYLRTEKGYATVPTIIGGSIK